MSENSVGDLLYFDYLIVGGGSAGCVLASRLSENPAIKVLLCEAGQEAFGTKTEAAISDARFRTMNNSALLWPGLVAENTVDAKMAFPFGQAKVLGGGSSINGMHIQRGFAEDYEEWTEFGVEGWGWKDVLPYFKRVETDCDFNGAEHGTSGPLKIKRIPEQSWSLLSKAIGTFFNTVRGLPKLRDLNADLGDGFGSVPLNINGDHRLSAASAYLPDSVRRRPNLTIRMHTEVRRLVFDNGRAVGVEVGVAPHTQVIRAKEIVISSGAVHTPALLMRSGVGPEEALQKMGIPVVRNRRGVGSNLLNHPLFIVCAHLVKDARQSKDVLHPCPMLVRYSSGVDGCAKTDMVLDVWERTPGNLKWDPLGNQIANLMVIINKVYSSGSVMLDPANVFASPIVKFNLLEDERDLKRMVDSLRLLQQMVNGPVLSAVVNQAFVPIFTPAAMALLQDNLKAQVMSSIAALSFSGSKALREKVLNDSGIALDDAVSSEEKLRAVALGGVLPGGHVAGTCRMGSPDDPNAVLDSRCRVIGIDGLRVVDASIFPTLMAAGTNLPVMMAAEKAAEMMIEDSRRN